MVQTLIPGICNMPFAGIDQLVPTRRQRGFVLGFLEFAFDRAPPRSRAAEPRPGTVRRPESVIGYCEFRRWKPMYFLLEYIFTQSIFSLLDSRAQTEHQCGGPSFRPDRNLTMSEADAGRGTPSRVAIARWLSPSGLSTTSGDAPPNVPAPRDPRDWPSPNGACSIPPRAMSPAPRSYSPTDASSAGACIRSRRTSRCRSVSNPPRAHRTMRPCSDDEVGAHQAHGAPPSPARRARCRARRA